MTFTESSLPGVIIVDLERYEDERGFFAETHHRRRYAEEGVDAVFVQDNLSHSKRNILRGLHYQLVHPQGKLIYVTRGEIFDVAVDIRRGSATFGKWTYAILSEHNMRQLFVPPGFAHGYCVLSEVADVIYKCTDFYAPGDEYGILWSDPAIGVEWPVDRPVLSAKDHVNPKLEDIPENHLPE